MSTALMAPMASSMAAPPAIRQPALRAVNDQGLLDSVADRGSQLINQMRDGASGLVDSAMTILGVRYKLGGNSVEGGFDCSGFTRYVFENSIGRVLPHRADEQANDPRLAKVDQKDLKPGDLVFFNTMRRTFSHVGIYLGDGKFIHSPRSGESVRIEDINISYWARHFTGARRAPELANAEGGKPGGSRSVLASLAATLSGQGGSTTVNGANASVVALAPAEPAMAAFLNPSGLRVGSTLPPVSNGGVAGFVPAREPSARPRSDF